MRKFILITILIPSLIFGACNDDSIYLIENKNLSRSLIIKDSVISTLKITNKLNKKTLIPTSCEEFKLRLSSGTSEVNSDIVLSSKDFKVLSVEDSEINDTQIIIAHLENKKHNLLVDIHYELAKDDFYIRKYLEIQSKERITLERVDVEVISFKDAYQPYTLKEITAQGPSNWKTGLGQPLYTTESAAFWGVEFPAASNFVENNTLNCGYLWGNELEENNIYTSYKAVFGVAGDYEFIDDAFYKYIEEIRVRPLRLQVQYNSWFDYGQRVDKEKFKQSVQKINNELIQKRNVKPLNAYVIDDGWQDSKENSDWSDKLWKINQKFTPKFEETTNYLDSLNSKLGLWLSPGCFFGARPIVENLEKNGFERLELSMSMTGPKYMNKLEERILELTNQGVEYFKFDGIFGHLNIRDFELNGRGTPAMTQLDTKDFLANDERLNDTIYDELKTYYLVNGTERLIQIFDKMSTINPDVFISITNGAYLSPWWLQHIDVVWMINAGDAAGGSTRTDELCYRDGVYYEIWETENTKFPMNAIFNHEPKKVKKGEDIDTFRKYLYMNLSRGTGFIELYLKTNNLVDEDWDVISEGLKWTYQVFPTFNNVKMHGGNPRNKEVYGFSAWSSDQGYISIHNPSDTIQNYDIVLNKKNGVIDRNNTYFLSSPIEGGTVGLSQSYNYGDTLSIQLKPKEIRILNFNREIVDWTKLIK